MSKNFRLDVQKAVEAESLSMQSGSSISFTSASYVTATSGSVVNFHSPILIPFASASALPRPPAGTGSLYVKSTDNKIYFQTDHGTEYDLTSGGGGGGTPGGSDTQIQYNDGGSFGGIPKFIWNDTNLFIADDTKLYFGSNSDASIEYDENGNNVLAIDGAATKFTVAGVEIENASDSGATALLIDNDDTDKIALDIEAANITADVIQITADALTDSYVMDVTADALTTGGILNLVSDSSDTSTRTLVTITNDNAAAVGTTLLHIKNDALASGPDTSVLIESTAAESDALLELRNSNASISRAPILKFNRSDTSAEADDMNLGQIDFYGADSGNTSTSFAKILVEATDITNNDEGGKIAFSVMAGGTAGTAAFKELFTIGGEDVANTTPCEVIVNNQGIDCDFRVEGDDETHLFFVDGGNNRISIGDNTGSPGATLEVKNNATAGAYNVPLVQLNNNDTDQIALDIDAANIDADVIDITADAVTTAYVMDITADALTTGGILNLVSDSSATTTRTLVKITNDNTSGVAVACLHIVNDAIASGGELTTALIESTADDPDNSTLELRNSNAAVDSPPRLTFNRSDTGSEADDMDLGRITFKGADSGNASQVFANILAEASDVTAGDEGGYIKFVIASGGTAGTAASNELFNIGGEDVANSTPCEVVINEAGIDCNFRVEGDTIDTLFADAGTDSVHIGDIVANTMTYRSPVQQSWNLYKDLGGATSDPHGFQADAVVSGEIIFLPSTATSAGGLYYLTDSAAVAIADADAESTSGPVMLLIAAGSNANRGMLVRGYARVSSTVLPSPATASIGDPIYVSTSSGRMSFTAPSGNNDVVRIVGYCVQTANSNGSSIIYFNPSTDYITVVA